MIIDTQLGAIVDSQYQKLIKLYNVVEILNQKVDRLRKELNEMKMENKCKPRGRK